MRLGVGKIEAIFLSQQVFKENCMTSAALSQAACTCPFKTVIALALAAIGLQASAGEGYKLRQSPVGAFGGEMAAGPDNPGFFGTASLSQIRISKFVDENGNKVKPPAIPPYKLNPALPYAVTFPEGTLDFHQDQTQLNLMGGYLTETTYAEGRLAFVANLPLIKQSRSFTVNQPLGTVVPTPTSPPLLPAQLAAINGGAVQANNTAQAGVAAKNAAASVDASGLGDAELSMAWIRHQDRLKVAAGVSLFVPTGDYDKARGPNPGSGNFYTLRPGVAVTYSLNAQQTTSDWDSGVTVGGRLSFGINSVNKDTQYRSGNFVYAEAGIVKVVGNWAMGLNLSGIQQISDDSGPGTVLGRYQNYGAGPFLSYKLPGQDAGFNLHYNESFGGRNALVTQTLQLRFIKAW